MRGVGVAKWLKRSTHDPRVVALNPITGQVTLCPWARHLTPIGYSEGADLSGRVNLVALIYLCF
jgi:hypothetical protein